MVQTKNPQNKIALLILAVFAVISLLWSVFIPVFESPDESTDYEFGRYYGRTWKLPVLTDNPRPQGVHFWEPLYFYILGSVSKAINAPLSEDSKYMYSSSDQWKRLREQHPLNLHRHEPSEFKFNWDEIAWSLHLMRLVSVLLSVGSVWFVYKMGREVFPEPSWLPIAGMMLFAFNPQFLFLGSALNVVDMVIFSTAILLWLLVRFMKRKVNKAIDIIVLGASMGMAILSKMTALPILAVAVVGICWKRIVEKKPVVNAILLFLIIFLLTGGWYLLRNQALYGELTGAKIHVLARFGKMTNPFLEEVGLLNFLISYPKTQWKTFWSGFGWITIYLPMIFPFTMLMIYAHGIWGFVVAIRERTNIFLNGVQKRQLMVLAMAPIVVWLAISRVIFIVEVFHGKDLFPVSGAAALIVVVGWRTMWEIFGSSDWDRGWIKKLSMPVIFLLSIFWFKQPELARFFKGIANMTDVWRMIGTGILAAIALKVFWKLVSNQRSREIFRKLVVNKENQIALLILGIIAISELAILFLMVVQGLYNMSIRELLRI
ncbi:glycosyltransferase family 39 protein [Candidatus Collierbacteria bacterium]|nr:glycosyltransferase family 39 protein [Candidatus Collierbacteria bacterium]